MRTGRPTLDWYLVCWNITGINIFGGGIVEKVCLYYKDTVSKMYNAMTFRRRLESK